MFCVHEINSCGELTSLADRWRELLVATPGGGFFQSLPWLQTYWQHFGADQQLRVLVVEEQGRIVGIVPLVVRNETTRVGQVRVLTYPLHDWGSFYAPIGPDPQQTLAAALGHVRRSRHQWDLLELRWIDRDTTAGSQTAQVMRDAGFAVQEGPWCEGAWADLSLGWQSYWAARRSHWRTNVRRNLRRLEEQGTVQFVRFRPQAADDPRWDLYETCVNLAQQSWQADATDGTTLTHDTVRAFLRAAHGEACRAAAVDLNLLLHNEQPVAFAYNYRLGDGVIYGLRTGFAQAAPDGAGTVLFYQMLHDSCLRGDRAVDLGCGYFTSKRQWETTRRTSYRCSHFPWLRPRTQVLRLKRYLDRLLTTGA